MSITTRQEQAITLAQQGFRVIRLRADQPQDKRGWPGKRPVDRGFWRASRDLDAVRALFAHPDPHSGQPYNIGIATDEWLVIDVDVRDGKGGEASFEQLMQECNIDPATVVTKTPNGWHYWYRIPPDYVAKTQSGLRPGVDIRGYHGQVVAVGSTIGGKPYAWERAPELGFLDAPAQLLELCRYQPKQRNPATPYVAEGFEPDTEEVAAFVERWSHDAPEAVQGAGGREVTKQVLLQCGDLGLTAPLAVEVLDRHWNREKASPSWDPEELMDLAIGLEAVREQPIGHKHPAAQFDVVVEPEATVKANGHDKPHEISNRAAERFPIERFKDMQFTPDVNYLVKNFVPREGVGVIWGPPKSLKSFTWFDLSMHIARGLSYYGRPVKQGTVVYCAFEGVGGYGARAAAYRQYHKIAPETDIPLYLMPARINLIKEHPQLIAALRYQLGTDRPAMIVLDTLNRSFVGSESKDEDMTAYFLAADALCKEFGCFVLIIHHCGLDGTRPRGHTSLTGGVAAQYAQRRQGDKVTIEVEFMRDGPEGEKIEGQLLVLNVGTDVEGDAIKSCVIVPRAQSDFDIALTPEEEEWMEKLEAWTEDRREELGVRPDTNIPITVKVVREVIFAITDSESANGHFDKKGASRQSIQRKCSQLLEKGALRKLQYGQWVIAKCPKCP